MSVAQYRGAKRATQGLDRLLPRREKYYDSPDIDKRTQIDATILAEKSHQSLVPQLQKIKINQKICQWYESWSSTQQKILLCGLTKMCTTTQLESIATSLEPLFHLDVMRKRNTLRPLAKPFRKKKKKAGLSMSEGGARVYTVQSLRKKTRAAAETSAPNLIPPSPPTSDTEGLTEGHTDAEVIAKQHTSMETVSEGLPTIMSISVSKIDHTKSTSDIFDDKQSPISPRRTASPRRARSPLPVMCGSSAPKPKNKRKAKEFALAKLDKRVTSKYHNALAGHDIATIRPVAMSLDVSHSQHRTQISSQVSVTQFFSSQNCGKEILRAKFIAKKSSAPGLQHSDIPIQKMYKPAVYFSKKSPRQGEVLVQPSKDKLTMIFDEQLHQIWEWMDNWKSYERLEIVAMIMKISDASLLTYLANCLCQRLQERVDIGWLSDDLLIKIFFYLPAEDIYSCSEVCRRWYHVAGNEDLWKNKCTCLGAANQIPRPVSFMGHQHAEDQEKIDWRLAYLELKNVISTNQQQADIRARKQEADERIRAQTPKSPQTIINDLPDVRVWKLMLAKGPRMKLGHKLAKDSERLKSTYRNLLSNSATRTYALRLAHAGDDGVPDEDPKNKYMFQRAMSVNQTALSSAVKEAIAPPKQPEEEEIRSDLINDEFEERVMPVNQQESEQALDVWQEPVQAKELLGRDPLRYLESWVTITCDMNSNDVPKQGGIPRLLSVRKLNAHFESVRALVYDRKRFLSGSMDRSIRLWDFRSGQCFHKLTSHKGGISSLYLDVNTLYSGSWDMTIMVWDLRYFERLATLTGHRDTVIDLWMVDDKLVSASHDGTVRIWDVKYFVCIKVLHLHSREITSMVIDYIEDTVITGSSDKTIKITTLHSQKTIRTLISPDPVNCLILQAGLILSTNYSGKLTFWNKFDGKAEAVIQAHDKQINCLGFRGSCFYTGSDDMTIKEWDLLTLTCLRVLMGHKGKIQCIRLDRQFLVSTDSLGNIRIWDFMLDGEVPDDGDDNKIMVKQLEQKDLATFLNGGITPEPQNKEDAKEEDNKDNKENSSSEKRESSSKEKKEKKDKDNKEEGKEKTAT